VTFIALIVLLALQGLIVGAFARLALPGKDPLSLLETIAVGVAGSLIAGVLFYLVAGDSAMPGFLGALVCSVGIVYLIRRARGGGLTRPGGDGPQRRF